MSEVFNEDVLATLVAERDRTNEAIRAVHDLARHDGQFTVAATQALVTMVKAQVGPGAKEYKGKARPVPVVEPGWPPDEPAPGG